MSTTIHVNERSVADLLTAALERTTKTQREVAVEIGYAAPNIITMFKQGHTRVPIAVAPRLAKALGLDPALFTRACLQEYMPDMLRALEETFGPFPLRH